MSYSIPPRAGPGTLNFFQFLFAKIKPFYERLYWFQFFVFFAWICSFRSLCTRSEMIDDRTKCHILHYMWRHFVEADLWYIPFKAGVTCKTYPFSPYGQVGPRMKGLGMSLGQGLTFFFFFYSKNSRALRFWRFECGCGRFLQVSFCFDNFFDVFWRTFWAIWSIDEKLGLKLL